MTDSELDQIYTDFCNGLNDAGEANALRVLSRFALLSMLSIDDAKTISALIARALKP